MDAETRPRRRSAPLETNRDHLARMSVTGAVTIGIIAHGDSIVAGHGPGVTCLLTSRSGALHPVIDPDANIGIILGLI